MKILKILHLSVDKSVIQLYNDIQRNILHLCNREKTMKLSDNDFEIMNIIWDEGVVTALEISHRLAEKKGWEKLPFILNTI